MRILITGGAGFVGSNLARNFRRESNQHEITVLDNLRRRGSEINVPILGRENIKFVHGDIRNLSDLIDIEGNFDVMIEASAEPSVLSGIHQSPSYVVDTNLGGTLNCLEFARQRAGAFIFLSTSRVYSISALKAIPLCETPTRFDLSPGASGTGISERGISEGFSTLGARSFYGATKLASELLIQEYEYSYRLPSVVNRCGVICGPGQFGKSDQGVFSLWMMHHQFGIPLKYTGFGGEGKQVRDLLHPDDLFELIALQLEKIEKCSGQVFNVGGGRDGSISLAELTQLCQTVFGRVVPVGSDPSTNTVDVPFYVTDNSNVSSMTGWRPRRSLLEMAQGVQSWIRGNRDQLRELFQLGNLAAKGGPVSTVPLKGAA